MAPRDVRLCFLGDSLTAGIGDIGQKGWVGRLAEGFCPDGIALTHYNLGVRTDTSSEVISRWRGEVSVRLRPDATRGIVVSFGVNDTRDSFVATHPVELTVGNLDRLLMEAGTEGLPVLVVGLLPVADPAHNERSRTYDSALQSVCARRDVPFIEVFSPMLQTPEWMREVPLTDGLHPGPAGYQKLAECIAPRWRGWLRSLTEPAITRAEARLTTRCTGIAAPAPDHRSSR